MIPYKLDGYKYYGYGSKLYEKYIKKLTLPKVQKIISDFKAVIIMDIPFHDLVIWSKDKVCLSINYDKYDNLFGDVTNLCIENEWYEECQGFEDLIQLRGKLAVYDLLNDTDGIDIKKIQKNIIDGHDLDFK